MAEHDKSRRAFLKQAAVGAGTMAGASLVPDVYGQNHDVGHQGEPGEHPNAIQQGAFFNYENAQTIAAFAERLMPGAPGKPGALDAGVLHYIDLALAGAYSDLQEFYRHGLTQLDAYCRKSYNAPFVRLDAAQQDAVIGALEAGKAEGFTWPAARAFFEVVRTHTMEGMFADPIYGGNKDFAGWRLVGFPGAQALFSASDLQSQRAFTHAPIGLQMTGSMPTEKG